MQLTFDLSFHCNLIILYYCISRFYYCPEMNSPFHPSDWVIAQPSGWAVIQSSEAKSSNPLEASRDLKVRCLFVTVHALANYTNCLSRHVGISMAFHLTEIVCFDFPKAIAKFIFRESNECHSLHYNITALTEHQRMNGWEWEDCICNATIYNFIYIQEGPYTYSMYSVDSVVEDVRYIIGIVLILC